METGILPRGGSLEDQDPFFAEAFPGFVAHWRERRYGQVWKDVRDYTEAVLEAVLGKRKGGGGGDHKRPG